MAKGFPFVAAQPVGLDEATLLRDGYQATGATLGGSNSAGSLAVGFVVGELRPQTGSLIYVKSITLTSLIDVNVWIEVIDASLIANSAVPTITSVDVGPNRGNATVEINGFIREGELIRVTLRTAVASGGGTNTLDFRAGFHARRFTNDLAFEAPKTMLVIGDSITNTTGPSFGSEFYHTRVALDLKSQGKHYRRIVKGDGGWKSSHAVYAMKRGWFEVSTPDLITVMLGTNETVLADYQANMPQLVDYLKASYPKAVICLIGPPPRQDSVETSVLVPLRSWLSSYVTGLANPNIYFTTVADSFDRTDANNYVATDGAAGTRVHPTGTAHGLMKAAIMADWLTQGITGRL